MASLNHKKQSPSKVPERLFKYRSLQDDKRVEWVADILLNDHLYFPTRREFNDPFDCRLPIRWDVSEEILEQRLIENATKGLPKHKADNQRARIRFLKETGEIKAATMGMGKAAEELALDRYGIFCMSKISDDILMWSHYADSHKGICIEFQDAGTGFLANGSIHPVTYPEADKYPEIDVSMSSKVLGQKLLLTKSLHWKYEKEWRMMDLTGGVKSFPAACLTGVILGCEISKSTEEKIVELLSTRAQTRSLPTQLYRSVRSNERFALSIVPIRKFTPPLPPLL